MTKITVQLRPLNCVWTPWSDKVLKVTFHTTVHAFLFSFQDSARAIYTTQSRFAFCHSSAYKLRSGIVIYRVSDNSEEPTQSSDFCLIDQLPS